MGILVYAGSTRYEMDDDMLAHARAVVIMKLRRHECFLLSWIVELRAGSGRVSLWVAPGIPLEFAFSHPRQPPLDPRWLSVLTEMSNAPRGLVLVSRDEASQIRAGQQAPTV